MKNDIVHTLNPNAASPIAGHRNVRDAQLSAPAHTRPLGLQARFTTRATDCHIELLNTRLSGAGVNSRR